MLRRLGNMATRTSPAYVHQRDTTLLCPPWLLAGEATQDLGVALFSDKGYSLQDERQRDS